MARQSGNKRRMTTIKVEKDTATALALIARGKGISVDKLIRDAIKHAFPQEMKGVDMLAKKETGEDKQS